MIVSVFLAQFPISTSIQDNVEMILSLLREAQGGDIVVFPADAVSGFGDNLTLLRDLDQNELSDGLDELRALAQTLKIHLCVGSYIRDGSHWFNTAIVFTPNGVDHRYHKVNLTNHEREVVAPGADLPVLDLGISGGTLKIGIQISQEIVYPEQWHWLARQGAQVFIHLNNAIGDTERLPVWRSHLVSYAAATQRYVISVNNAAGNQMSPTTVVSPKGQMLVEFLSDQTVIKRVELDLSEVSNEYLHQSRQDLVRLGQPRKKERRKILRRMKLLKLENDLKEIRRNTNLFNETNLAARMEALEFISLIEDMHTLRPRDRQLGGLFRRALELREHLERINAYLFSKLRGQIQRGDYTPDQLRKTFNQYTDYRTGDHGQPHYGYESLDGLISGVFLSKPAPEETQERKPGMVHYQRTPSSVILELIDEVKLSADDVFFDLGSGLGQVVGLVNILTKVPCVGVEYQSAYHHYAIQMVSELGLNNITFINADAQDVPYGSGTVFFLFNPFGGRIFDAVFDKLRSQAKKRKITICSYGSSTEPISELSWLEVQDPDTIHDFKLAIFNSKTKGI
jgi:predicted amidohydrolase